MQWKSGIRETCGNIPSFYAVLIWGSAEISAFTHEFIHIVFQKVQKSFLNPSGGTGLFEGQGE
jgi:hypothetical protein